MLRQANTYLQRIIDLIDRSSSWFRCCLCVFSAPSFCMAKWHQPSTLITLPSLPENQTGMHAKPSRSFPFTGVRMRVFTAPYCVIMTLGYRHHLSSSINHPALAVHPDRGILYHFFNLIRKLL